LGLEEKGGWNGSRFCPGQALIDVTTVSSGSAIKDFMQIAEGGRHK
jgi:hypothetical protein